MPDSFVTTVFDIYRKATFKFYAHTDTTADKELLGWSSKETQFKRFEILLKLAQQELALQSNDSIVDIGCGYAALLVYIKHLGYSYQYTGIDSNKAYIQETRKRFPQSLFYVFDVLNSEVHMLPNIYDVVFLSGVWNLDMSVYFKDETDKYRAKYAIIEFILSIMCRSTRKGVVCNFLHTNSKDKYYIFNYHDPKVLIDYLESKLFNVQAYKEGYLDNDFTVVFLPMK